MKQFANLLLVGSIVLCLIILPTFIVSAQVGTSNWTKPYRLSSQIGQVGDEVIFADTFGYVHLFWPETEILDHNTIIYYSRFDGETWTLPTDILVAPASTNLSATFDLNGKLHLLFTDGANGNVFYTESLIHNATSAKGWQPPKRLEISARSIDFKVSSKGVFHLLYSGNNRSEPGVYYTNSFDEGQSWTSSVWLDPDIPPDLTPSQIQLEIGKEDSLHAIWFYWDQDYLGRWIRYANSFDLGLDWSVPFTVDKVEAGSEELRLPAPALKLSGTDVHIIWSGDYATHRKQRISRNSGYTWSQAEFIFGDLLGQAIGDGLAVDAIGRLHFFGQIRYPQGIYHAYWDHARWSLPSLIYLIAQDAFESRGERIHAHRVRADVRSGNQLVVVFTTSPGDPQSILYEMHMTMQNVPALEKSPLPKQIPTPTMVLREDTPSTTIIPLPPTSPPNLNFPLDENSPNLNSPSKTLFWAIFPVVLLIVLVVSIRLFYKNSN